MKENLDKTFCQARSFHIPSSVQKINLVADLIRKKDTSAALIQLQYCRKKVAKYMYELLKSAISNAENNHGMDIDSLYVKEVLVGRSFTMKRFHARARGRASRVEKARSMISILVAEK